LQDVAALVYLVNQACITPHVWLSQADKLRLPDQMIFDVDPSSEDLATVIGAARALKDVLEDMDLPAYVKATGSRASALSCPSNASRISIRLVQSPGKSRDW